MLIKGIVVLGLFSAIPLGLPLPAQAGVQQTGTQEKLEQEIARLNQEVAKLRQEIVDLEARLDSLRQAQRETLIRQVFPGIFRFPGINQTVQLEDENVSSIRIFRPRLSSILRMTTVYVNKTERYRFRPDLTVDLFDRDLVFLGRVRDRWLSDTVGPGETYSYDVSTGLGPEQAQKIAWIRIALEGRPVSTPETNPDPPAPTIAARKGTVAVVLVVDRSMSMGERLAQGDDVSKMDHVKNAVLDTVGALQDMDELGIVTFGNRTSARTELVLTPVSDKPKIEQAVLRMAPARESTYLSSGLDRAGHLLEDSDVERLIVVVTDGVFQDDLLATRTARQLAGKGITPSLIQISGSQEAGAAQSRRFARAGGGRYIQVSNAGEISQSIISEINRVLGR